MRRYWKWDLNDKSAAKQISRGKTQANERKWCKSSEAILRNEKAKGLGCCEPKESDRKGREA